MHSLATTTNVISSDTGCVSQPGFSLVWHDFKLTQPHVDWRTFRACPLWLHFWSVQLNFLTGWVSALQRTGFSHFVWEELLGYQYHRGTMGNPMSGTTGTYHRTSMPPISSFYFTPFICVCGVYWGTCVEVMKITCGINSFLPPVGFRDWAQVIRPLTTQLPCWPHFSLLLLCLSSRVWWWLYVYSLCWKLLSCSLYVGDMYVNYINIKLHYF